MKDNATRIACPETLDQSTGRELLDTLRQRTIQPGEVIVLDFSQTKSMDSRGGAWLIELADHVRAQEAEFRWDGESDRVARFLDFIRPSLAERDVVETTRVGFFERIGDTCFHVAGEGRKLVDLIVDAIYWAVLAPLDRKRIRWSLVFDEVYEMGVRAIRINFLMNFLLGLIIAMLSSAQLEAFGAQIFVADLVVIAFARELAAVMTAVVVSARTGAAIAAEIATMKVQEEIDALRGLGLNVAQFLVAPKLLALLVVMPCLVALGMVAGVLGGAVWGTTVLDIDRNAWSRQTMNATELSDVLQGFAKGELFALAIVLIGCHNGLQVTGGSRGVGLMTTRAVVWDIFAIISIDMVFAAIFYYIL